MPVTECERLLRVMAVRRWRDLTPRMRRITLCGEDVAFLGGQGLHARLLFPEGDHPQWPQVSADGRPVWKRSQPRMPMRAYTLRHIRPEHGEVDIDFLLHDGEGVAAAWARQVKAGDLLGVIGPVGRMVEKADWYLFAGDESSLPPIARMLEALPADARGMVLMEVEGEQERQHIIKPEGVELRWLFRDEAEPQQRSRVLAKAVVEMPVPETGRIACWLGAELTTFQIARAHWRGIAHIDETRVHVAPYWNAGKQPHVKTVTGVDAAPVVLYEAVDHARLGRLWREECASTSPRDAADFTRSLDVTEAHLAAAALGSGAVRLDNNWEEIVRALPDAGKVTVVTQNHCALHRKTGVFDRIMWNEERPVVLDRNINLRIRLESWVHCFFLEAGFSGWEGDGLHIFDGSGVPVLRVLATTRYGALHLRKLAERYADPDQGPDAEIRRCAPAPVAVADSEIDAGAMAADWRSMLDTHDIFAFARRYGAQRTQSYRLVPDDLACEVDRHAFFDVLDCAARDKEGVMIFVGSPGNVQIHIGPVSNISSARRRFMIDDETFGLDIIKDRVASCWVVTKPTVDGEIRSVEMFDAQGAQIAWVFGERRPGSPQKESWHRLVERVCIKREASAS